MDQQAVIGVAVSMTTAIFWAAFTLGSMWAQLKDHGGRIAKLEKQ